MEEVDLSIEINRLCVRGEHQWTGVWGQVERPRFYRTCGLQHTAPIWKGKDEGGKREGEGGRGTKLLAVG